MDKYTVKLYSRADRDLDNIYSYIAHNLLAPSTAVNMVDALEEAIYSLETLPERGSMRQTGIYANQGYRQLFVKNYVIIYKVLKDQRQVHVVTVRYAPSQFWIRRPADSHRYKNPEVQRHVLPVFV